jgi:uncharacterized protein (TIGR00730 family)
MKDIHSVCVFCGSSPGSEEIYTRKAQNLGLAIANAGITLVYGGSRVGLMRVIADTVLQAGGRVVGVMPQHLIDCKVAHTENTEFYAVENMAERKALMEQLSDAFIAMPGGMGTLDEIFEMIGWNQLEIIEKPVAFFNVAGFFDFLMKFLDHAVNQRFIKKEYRLNLICESDEKLLLEKINNYSPMKVTEGKWIMD